MDTEHRTEAAPPLLSLRGISKSYPGVQALSGIDLDLRAGQGTCLVGENGAGKSTLIKVIAGLVHPDSGEVRLRGVPVRMRTPAEAQRLRISLVPQEISLADDRSVAENVFLGRLPRAGMFVAQRKLVREAAALLKRLGMPDVDVRRPLSGFPPAVKQMAMIARGIASDGELFILDEPTAALTNPECERLFSVIDDLKTRGCAVLYVSHRLPELSRVAEHMTVLRDGRVVAEMRTDEATEAQVVQAMVGRSVERFFDTQATRRAKGPAVLEVSGLSRRGAFRDIDFTIAAGEIVGLAGLVGAGRSEVARAVAGLDRYDAGDVAVDGARVRLRNARQAIKAGLALVPEERKAQALVLTSSISRNIVLPHLRELSKFGWFRERRLTEYSRGVARAVNVKAPGVHTPVGSLSGGNQQKVVLGRWFASNPKVYLLDEPTRGIDVGAKAEIYHHIGRFAEKGAGVLVISSELPELLGICDRILVMREGRIVGNVEASEATEESLLDLALGASS